MSTTKATIGWALRGLEALGNEGENPSNDGPKQKKSKTTTTKINAFSLSSPQRWPIICFPYTHVLFTLRKRDMGMDAALRVLREVASKCVYRLFIPPVFRSDLEVWLSQKGNIFLALGCCFELTAMHISASHVNYVCDVFK